MTYRIFDTFIRVELMGALLVCMAFCLFALKLRTILFLTLVALLLPSLEVFWSSTEVRLIRWPLLLALVGKGLFTGTSRGLAPRPVTGAHRLLILLSVLILASWLWSIGPGRTLAQGGMFLLLLSGVFLVVWNSWGERSSLPELLNILYLVAALLFSFQFLCLVFGWYVPGQTGRIGGAFENPNGAGTAVAFFSPFVYWKFRTTTSPALRNFTLFLGVVMLVSLVLSGSRSGFMGAAVCLTVIFFYVHRAKVVVLFLATLLPIGALVFLAPRLPTEVFFDSRMIRQESLGTFSDRLPVWIEAVDLIRERPFLGYGYGTNGFVVLGSADLALFQTAVYDEDLRNYHSTHFQLALDLGLIGLMVFWLFLISVLRRGIRLFRMESDDPPLQLAGVAFFGAFLALLGDSFVHGWVFAPGSSMAIIFWLVSAAILRIHLFLEEPVIETQEATEQTSDVGVRSLPTPYPA